jgi:hypothetical protein
MPDSLPHLPRGLRAERIAWRLAHLGTALLAIYCIVVTADLLPPLVLDPRWQFGLANVLVNSCSFPLVGLGLWHLAGHLAPDEQQLQRLLDRLARLAVLAVIGYLLLMPLQLWSLWTGVSAVNQQQSGQLAQVLRRADQMQAAVRSSGSVAELQSRLQAMQGPALDAASLNQPLPVLKQQLLAAIAQVRAGAGRNARGPQPQELWPLGKQALRSMVLALVAAFGLASLSRSGPAGLSLLQVLGEGARRWKQFLFNNQWLRRWREASEDKQEQRQRRQRVVALQRMRRNFEEIEDDDEATSSGSRHSASPGPAGWLRHWRRSAGRGRPEQVDPGYLGKLLEQAEREEREEKARARRRSQEPQDPQQ